MSVKRIIASGLASGKAIGKKAGTVFLKTADDIAAVPERLGRLAESLETECRAVETDFMQLGQTIQSLHGDTAGLASKTRELVETIGGNSEDAAVAQVKQTVALSLEKLEKCRSGVSGNLERVTRITEKLRKLGTRIAEAEKIGMLLKVVSLNIQIESARSRASHEMFTLFSHEIRNLSGKIIEVAGNIRDNSAEALLSQHAAHSAISKDLNHLNCLVAEGKQTVETALGSIEKIMTLSVAMMDKASDHARKITDAIAEVVVGIQFHDSLSQRVAHIAGALEDAAAMCAQAAHCKTGEEEQKASALATAHSIVAIQAAQLKRVVSEIDSVYQLNRNAIGQIGSELGEVAQRLSGVTQKGRVEDQMGGERIVDCFRNLQSGLIELQRLIEQGEDLMSEISEVVARASGVTHQLTGYAEVVREIGYETHIKALNAIVNAAHLDENGKSLEILAQQIKTSSDSTDRFVTDVTGIIDSIAVQDPSDTSEAAPDESDRPDVERLQNDIVKSLSEGAEFAGITEVQEMFTTELTAVFQQSDSLKQAVLGTRDDLAFLPALESRLAELLEGLEDICGMLAPWSNEDAADTAKLAERYTMQQERSIHEAIAKIPVPSGQAVPDGDPGQDAESGEFVEDDLGDNVELF